MSRLSLHQQIKSIVGNNVLVAYQPTNNIHLTYPCVIYELDRIDDTYSNDNRYLTSRSYTLTVIDKEPDSHIFDILYEGLEFVTFERMFVEDNLYHYQMSVTDNKNAGGNANG